MNELYENYLEHHGVLGQKWGVRRYQNPDGSLTEAGRRHYGVEGEPRTAKQLTRRLNDLDKAIARNRRDANDSYKVITNMYNKSKKRIDKGKTPFTKRQEKKYIDNFKKNLKAREYIEQGEEETKRIINSIPDTMIMRNYIVPRDVQKRGEHFAYLMLGVLSSKTMPGIEYEVKNKKKSKENK